MLSIITIRLIYLYSYDSSTGTFTVPSGGDGYYFFSVYFTVSYDEYAYFDIEINGETICTAFGDHAETPDYSHTSCSGVTFAAEGKDNKRK